ncbi:MAG: hypothetical protein Q9164_005152 [Protoblastenia rupestris]
MAFAWKQAGLTYNRYLAVAARVVRRSLKEGPRLQAERRGEMELRFAKWEMTRLSLDGDDKAPPRPDLQPSPPIANIKPSGKSIPARDITKEFNKASKALHLNNLVQDESFTLFEAVGALEIMDPKMDSGYLADGETLEDKYDVLRDLSPEEVIGIMDQLLCFEMAWHMGFPLSQSLFTSHYIDHLLWPEPKNLDEARFDRGNKTAKGNKLLHIVLRAYCLSLIKTCDFVHRRLSHEKLFEEEDFVSHLFHRNLLSDFDLEDIQAILYEAIQFVQKDFKPRKDILRSSLYARLCLRDLLLHATNINGMIENHHDRYPLWDDCLPLIHAILKTNALSVPTEDSYSIKIQRRLAATSPPRPIVQTTLTEAAAFLERMCECGRDVFIAMNYQGPITLQVCLK